jgi:hypothetical protein
MATFSITSVKESDSVLLGLGRLGMGLYTTVPATVYTDVGYIKQLSFTYSRELKEFTSAGLRVKRLVFSDRATIQSSWAQVSVTNLQKIIQGTVNSPPTDILFGGQRTTTNYSVRFEHQRSDGKILQFNMFKTLPSGDYELAFAEEEFITYPVTFEAEADTSQADGQQYGSIKLISA